MKQPPLQRADALATALRSRGLSIPDTVAAMQECANYLEALEAHERLYAHERIHRTLTEEVPHEGG